MNQLKLFANMIREAIHGDLVRFQDFEVEVFGVSDSLMVFQGEECLGVKVDAKQAFNLVQWSLKCGY